MPVYLVTVEKTVTKLVDAPNQASARGHVARQVISTKVATGRELFDAAKSGGEMETAGELPAEPVMHESITGGETERAPGEETPQPATCETRKEPYRAPKK